MTETYLINKRKLVELGTPGILEELTSNTEHGQKLKFRDEFYVRIYPCDDDLNIDDTNQLQYFHTLQDEKPFFNMGTSDLGFHTTVALFKVIGEKIESDILRITGFDRVLGTVFIEDRGHFMVAYCKKANGTISRWFTSCGSFDLCQGAYSAMIEQSDYDTEYMDRDTELFVIWYQLNEDEKSAIGVCNQIYKNEQKRAVLYRDLLNISPELEPFKVADYL